MKLWLGARRVDKWNFTVAQNTRQDHGRRGQPFWIYHTNILACPKKSNQTKKKNRLKTCKNFSRILFYPLFYTHTHTQTLVLLPALWGRCWRSRCGKCCRCTLWLSSVGLHICITYSHERECVCVCLSACVGVKKQYSNELGSELGLRVRHLTINETVSLSEKFSQIQEIIEN